MIIRTDARQGVTYVLDGDGDEFDEAKHPRDAFGKFSAGEGSSDPKHEKAYHAASVKLQKIAKEYVAGHGYSPQEHETALMGALDKFRSTTGRSANETEHRAKANAYVERAQKARAERTLSPRTAEHGNSLNASSQYDKELALMRGRR